MILNDNSCEWNWWSFWRINRWINIENSSCTGLCIWQIKCRTDVNLTFIAAWSDFQSKNCSLLNDGYAKYVCNNKRCSSFPGQWKIMYMLKQVESGCYLFRHAVQSSDIIWPIDIFLTFCIKNVVQSRSCLLCKPPRWKKKPDCL